MIHVVPMKQAKAQRGVHLVVPVVLSDEHTLATAVLREDILGALVAVHRLDSRSAILKSQDYALWDASLRSFSEIWLGQ